MCADQQCFGDGTARDIADYKAPLKEEDITLKDTVPRDYPNNYLVPSLQKYADKNKPAVLSTQAVILFVAAGMMAVGAVVLIVVAILLVRGRPPQQPTM